ncbi:pentapeptide repeat protein [Azorhizobium sp. AG788]|uniref:pentapeptide repeat-containing protein n=1 Tax=Azorhizobium sp. AG788 TaxID=2183897 RepID=UPI0010600DA3|nr:pentapeptide repeat-containing protein [Azorhizobium sp. AG788]TDT92494.1 pentapeptide repeat protein [Azorhizobium sp. AG788]
MSNHRVLRENLDKDFVELTRLLQLDPQKDFAGCSLRHLDLRTADLAGFNFKRADLRGCVWDGASIAGTLFDDQSQIDRGGIIKARDWMDNPYLFNRFTSPHSTNEIALLALCARVLSIRWIKQDYLKVTAQEPIDKLMVVIEKEGATLDQAGQPDFNQLTKLRMHLVDWGAAHAFEDFEAMALCVRKLLYSWAVMMRNRSPLLRLICIIERIELHRMRADLFVPDSGEEIQRISERLECVLAGDEADDIEIMSSVLAYFRPKSLAQSLRPGVLFVGSVVNDYGDRIDVKGLGRTFTLADNLLSANWLYNRPAVKEFGFFATRRNNQITQRGAQFVGAVADMLFPFALDTTSPTEVFMGASNSWAVLITSPAKKSGFLANGGAIARQVQRACGIRRITITTRSDNQESEIKNFVNDGYADIKEIEINGSIVWGRLSHGRDRLLELLNIGDSVYQDGKVKTFIAMWTKVFPEFDIIVSIGGGSTFGSKGFREFIEQGRER